MSNLRPAPLFLTPQAVRGVLGIGHPKRAAELAVEGRVNAADKPIEAAKTVGGGKAMPSIGFIALRRDGGVSDIMTTQEFIKDKSPRAGFWRVRAKANSEIAAVVPPLPQSRDGALSSPGAVVVPAPIHPVVDAAAMLADGKPKATRQERAAARRVAAPVPASSETAGTGAIALVAESADPTPRRNASPVPVSRNWITNRFARIAAAIAYLKTKCILVQVIDRDELVKRYRVTGKRYPQYHDDVLDIATGLGWAG